MQIKILDFKREMEVYEENRIIIEQYGSFYNKLTYENWCHYYNPIALMEHVHTGDVCICRQRYHF